MGTFIRIAVIVAIGALIMLGIRRIWRDVSSTFNKADEEKHARDLAERGRPDVITLQRDKDGTFRPPEDRERR